MSKRLSLASVVLVLGLIAGFPSVALADEVSCVGTLSGVVDNVKVPSNGTCTMSSGTTVQGTIKVESDASLNANGVLVVGNIQAENHASVTVIGGSVGGSIQIKQGGSALISGVRVTGDIQFDHNNGTLNASGNTVGGSIQVVGNNGAITISNNTINGNLQCKENTPAPSGSGNIVGGNAEDQCETLELVEGAPVSVAADTGGTGSTQAVRFFLSGPWYAFWIL